MFYSTIQSLSQAKNLYPYILMGNSKNFPMEIFKKRALFSHPLLKTVRGKFIHSQLNNFLGKECNFPLFCGADDLSILELCLKDNDKVQNLGISYVSTKSLFDFIFLPETFCNGF
jgi:hypothetical protein